LVENSVVSPAERVLLPLETPLLGRTAAEHRARDVLAAAHRIARSLAASRAANDRAAWFAAEQLTALREAGLFRLTVPVEYGGFGLWQGQAYLPHFQILEAIASGDSAVSQLVQVHSGVTYLIMTLGSPALKERFAREIVHDGKLFASIGSEAPLQKAGPATYESTLQPADGGWIVHGIKNFATFAPVADYFLVWSLIPGSEPASERQVLALVPRDTPGVQMIDDWDTLGMRATMSWSINFDRVFVPQHMMVGRPGWWKSDASRVSFLLGPASNFLGTAQSALDFTSHYVAERPHLRASQVVLVRLGELSTAVSAARTAVYAAARMWEDESVHPDAAELNSIRAFHLARQTVLDVTSRCFDICGARTTFKIYPLEAAFRDARTYTLQHRDETFMELVGRAIIGESFSRHDEIDVAIKQG
jgi:alkylation response protein AidB-like acyl-CoA dehydrogenase